ncbi:MAG: 50S ribosomal protein L13 [Candidatus Campbellbacteria bacterium]|nr:50S ribosomal protein L13 [Candidatus Campbellbacteria bacterium]
MKEVTIDAKGQSLGRVATEVANVLNGKTDVNYAPNRVLDVSVLVKNVPQMKISGNKLTDKKYFSHSGYVGNDKTKTVKQVIEAKGKEEVLMRAVSGMLPKNKLRQVKLNKIKCV